MAKERQKQVIATVIKNGGKITGKELEKIGYSKSIQKTPSKVLKTIGVKTELQRLLQRNGINLNKALKPIKKGLQATKYATDKRTGEVYDTGIEDIPLQLQASDRALKLLELAQRGTQESPAGNSGSDRLAQAIENNVDEIELQRMVFKTDQNIAKSDIEVVDKPVDK